MSDWQQSVGILLRERDDQLVALRVENVRLLAKIKAAEELAQFAAGMRMPIDSAAYRGLMGKTHQYLKSGAGS